jgi:hypothetical protein
MGAAISEIFLAPKISLMERVADVALRNGSLARRVVHTTPPKEHLYEHADARLRSPPVRQPTPPVTGDPDGGVVIHRSSPGFARLLLRASVTSSGMSSCLGAPVIEAEQAVAHLALAGRETGHPGPQVQRVAQFRLGDPAGGDLLPYRSPSRVSMI